jgi:hypothetical protein
VTIISTSWLSAHQRIEILRGLPSRQIQVNCTGNILDTLFFSDDDMPFADPQVAIAKALSAYWAILECASRIFTTDEWVVLSGQHSPFTDSGFAKPPASSAAASIAAHFAGDDWNDEVLAVKALLPKIATLSDADFTAVNEILRYMTGLSCGDRVSAMSLKFSALKSQREPD